MTNVRGGGGASEESQEGGRGWLSQEEFILIPFILFLTRILLGRVRLNFPVPVANRLALT
jgi:hypothetical protein